MDIRTTEHLDQLSRARALAPAIAAASADIDRRRELLPETVAALIDNGFFRMLQPRFLGGAELPPMLFAQVTEILAQADASTAWCVCQNNGCAMSAAYLERDMAREIFGPPNGILAWGPPGAPYEAQPVPGGYRISGKWRFASGSHHATWLGAHMRVAGTNTVRTMLFPKSSAAMNDIWHTIGLRGTASDEYVVEDLFIPQSKSILRDTAAERKVDTALYRFTSNQLYSCGFAGVGLGIARATIKVFLDLPREKVSRGASRPLRENNVVQSQLAQSEARLRSARAFLHNTWEDAWTHVHQAGEQTQEDRAMIRLASTWAIQQAREVVTTLYHAAGSVAVFEDHPFERRLRDIHTVAQQAQGRQLHYETVGQILLGVDQENQF